MPDAARRLSTGLPAGRLRPHIPPELEIDTRDGQAWLGVVPFRMTGVRPRGLPAVRCTSDFPELNVRTYVRSPERSGVWFFSLDADNRFAVRLARAWYGLPYYRARIRVEERGEGVGYHSTRTHRGADAAEFQAEYRPTGATYRAEPDSLEHWLTERYALFSAGRRGRIGFGDIRHHPWPLQPAEAEIRINTMTAPLGICLPPLPPVLHFARQLEVVAWPVQPLGSRTLELDS